MSSPSFRFLHAGSFHLESTLRGVIDPPEHLHETLVNAPFRAAEQVFLAAIREEVDFVVLSGDILDPTAAGPRAVAFLHEQFTQLKQRDIPVYWSASKLDLTEEWLTDIEWPDNVHFFPQDGLNDFAFCRGEDVIAKIWGRSWNDGRAIRPGEFPEDLPGLHVGVLHTRGEFEHKQRGPMNYWALGGSNSAETLFTGVHTAHCPGSPQGFCPQESGPHGCTLVHVDGTGDVRTRMIPTASVQWYNERINLFAGIARETVHSELRSRAESLLAGSSEPLLICWRLCGLGRFDSVFAQAEQRAETLNWLRREFGSGDPAAWSVELILDPPHALRGEWCEEDSILGDYMQVVSRYQDEDERAIELEKLLPDRPLPSGVPARLLSAGDEEHRDRLLNQAAMSGLDLLRGDDSLPYESSASSS